ncbi:MAG: RNA 2'-phosphotransferase [Chloroflexi bacterium]|nr:RNA 2'-phosphotransferase [Chloroflexota bacterium]
MDYKRLSKTLAYALRHAPEEFGLELDTEGWVDVEDVLNALRARRKRWDRLAEHHLATMIARSDKKRYELRDGRIRAFYGHSVPEKMQKTPNEPPEVLYHGTSPRTAAIILEQGLKPMSRQYVHLSTDRSTADLVARRHSDESPVILGVLALDAHRAGVSFYHGHEDIWLADGVPAQFIRVFDQSDEME